LVDDGNSERQLGALVLFTDNIRLKSSRESSVHGGASIMELEITNERGQDYLWFKISSASQIVN
jgi:hypothetical protein